VSPCRENIVVMNPSYVELVYLVISGKRGMEIRHVFFLQVDG
jgi:hypothetical protein